MPAKSERQRRYMAMCATHGNRHARKDCPDMPKAKMREFMRKPR